MIFYISSSQVPCAIVATLNGNNITYGLRTQIATSGTQPLFPRIVKINDNILLVAFIEYYVGNRIKLASLKVSGTNIYTSETITLNNSFLQVNMDYLGDNYVA